MKRKLLVFIPSLVLLIAAQVVSAHSVVSPKQAGIGAFQTFSLGVPSEKASATVAVKLLIPEGLNFVTPNVKQGWKIDIKTGPAAAGAVAADGDTETTRITEIDWTGGSIPAGQRDDFLFSAQVPAQPTTLQWKVYQTYQDGSVVPWDQDPNTAQPKDSMGKMDFSKVGPFSTTQIVNDLNPTPATATPTAKAKAESNTLPIVLSLIGIILSVYAITKTRKQA